MSALEAFRKPVSDLFPGKKDTTVPQEVPFEKVIQEAFSSTPDINILKDEGVFIDKRTFHLYPLVEENSLIKERERKKKA